MRAIMVACALALSTPAWATEPVSPEEAWRVSIAKDNESYAKTPTAILKIDDAIYLKPGQTAFLIAQPDDPARRRFALLDPAALISPGPDAISVAFQDGQAVVTRGGAMEKRALDETWAYEIDAKFAMRLQLAQTAPGEEGLRAAVYNQDHPAAKAFTGLDYFPYDPALIFDAVFEPGDLAPETFQTSRGWYKEFYRAGTAVFEHAGVAVRLPVYAGERDPAKIDSLSVFFTDALTGTETYGVGRYMDMEVAAFPEKTVRLDFNSAYNPLCARSPHFNCPVATAKIPFAVRAGEKAPPEHPAGN